MDKYEYVVLEKEDFMVHEETNLIYKRDEDGNETDELIGGVTPLARFDVVACQKRLSHFGSEGYRVITKLYNSPHDWVLVLSRPLHVPASRSSGRTDM